eukprot:gene19924-gene20360
MTHAADIALGFYHSCAVSSQKGLMCWGYNEYGQLGIGTTTDTNTAGVVLPSGSIADLAAGSSHTCAINGYTLKCWGRNSGGQLGTGDQVDSSTPVAVLAGVQAVGVGIAHTCAIRTTGHVWCWGNNANGRLGDGTTTTSEIPLLISLWSVSAVSIGIGGQHSCVVLSNSSVACWGRNTNGQLGIGSNSDSYVPVLLPDTAGSATIAAGLTHTCVLYTVGTV